MRFLCAAVTAIGLFAARPSGALAQSNELGAWSQLGDLKTGRYGPGVVVIGSRIFAVGGDCGECSFPGILRTVEAYDPAANAWHFVAPMPEALLLPAAAAFDGKIYVFSGLQENVLHNTDVYCYDPLADQWTHEGVMPDLWEASAVTFGDRIYVVGGRTGWGAGPRTFTFSPTTGEWDEKSRFLSDRIASNHSLGASGPYLYLFAALDGDENYFDNFRVTERYDIHDDAWRRLSDIPLPRDRVGVAELGGRFFRFWQSEPICGASRL